MPLFEFFCNPCGRKIELLVMAGETPVCPRCRGKDLERLFSTFASPGLEGPSRARSCSSCGPGHNCASCK